MKVLREAREVVALPKVRAARKSALEFSNRSIADATNLYETAYSMGMRELKPVLAGLRKLDAIDLEMLGKVEVRFTQEDPFLPQFYDAAEAGHEKCRKKLEGAAFSLVFCARTHHLEGRLDVEKAMAAAGAIEAQAKRGSVIAISHAASLYTSLDFLKGPEVSMRWLLEAARNGDLDAALKVGMAYRGKEGSTYINNECAAYWLAKAGERHFEARYELAIMRKNGEIPEEPARVDVDFFLEAYDQRGGDAWSLIREHVIDEVNKRTGASLRLSERFNPRWVRQLELASAEGVAEAQYQLSAIYRFWEQSNLKFHGDWRHQLRLAAEQGHKKAVSELSEVSFWEPFYKSGLVFCPRCGVRFQVPPRTKGMSGVAAGIAAGVAIGSQVGIAAGPLGAIAGTVPGAIAGGLIGAWKDQKSSRIQCPACNVEFSLGS